jgi:hypothetical protein
MGLEHLCVEPEIRMVGRNAGVRREFAMSTGGRAAGHHVYW